MIQYMVSVEDLLPVLSLPHIAGLVSLIQPIACPPSDILTWLSETRGICIPYYINFKLVVFHWWRSGVQRVIYSASGSYIPLITPVVT